MQDVEVTGSTTAVTNYGLGARGIDFIERVGSSTVSGFPIYDAHGNNVATLTRSGTTFAIGDQRSYDAWGSVRAQQAAGDPKTRYCGSLGHKQDDESGLVYMRSRYYDPAAGRFVSEDPARDGSNWYVYALNQPTLSADPSGKTALVTGIEIGLFLKGLYDIVTSIKEGGAQAKAIIMSGLYFMAMWFFPWHYRPFEREYISGDLRIIMGGISMCAFAAWNAADVPTSVADRAKGVGKAYVGIIEFFLSTEIWASGNNY